LARVVSVTVSGTVAVTMVVHAPRLGTLLLTV
jgi:hypothetical protein